MMTCVSLRRCFPALAGHDIIFHAFVRDYRLKVYYCGPLQVYLPSNLRDVARNDLVSNMIVVIDQGPPYMVHARYQA